MGQLQQYQHIELAVRISKMTKGKLPAAAIMREVEYFVDASLSPSFLPMPEVKKQG